MGTLFEGIRKVYVDGRMVSPERAAISPFDRGFIFGDGIYEVIPAYGGRPFRWDEHLARLNGNLATVGIPQPLSRAEWQDLLADLLDGGEGRDQYIYLQVTRGVAPRDHAFPPGARPTLFAYSQLLKPVPAELLQKGVAAVTMDDLRWHRCDIKTTSLIANVWLRQQATERGAVEAIMVRDGIVTEGAAANVFAVIDGRIMTAPNGPDLLPGITRDLVIELLHRFDISHRVESFSAQAMRRADEVWLSSSTRELLPVTRIDDAAIGDGRPGPVFARVYQLFQDYKEACRSGAAG